MAASATDRVGILGVHVFFLGLPGENLAHEDSVGVIAGRTNLAVRTGGRASGAALFLAHVTY